MANSDPKRYVSVDSSSGESSDLVKMNNKNNEFSGTFYVQNGNTKTDIKDVFLKGIKVNDSPQDVNDGVVNIQIPDMSAINEMEALPAGTTTMNRVVDQLNTLLSALKGTPSNQANG